MKKTYLISGLVIVLIVIIGLWYFYQSSSLAKSDAAVETKVETLAVEATSNQDFNSPALVYLGASDAVKISDPILKAPIKSNDQLKALATKRTQLETLLKTWARVIAQASSLSDPQIQSVSSGSNQAVANYLNELSGLVGALSASSSGLSQAEIDAYKATLEEAKKKILTLDQSQVIIEDYSLPTTLDGASGKPKLIEGINHN